jgi:hypothetical protein
MRNSIWNKLEVIIVVGCNLLFIVSMFIINDY